MDCICISNLSNHKAVLPVTCWTVFFWVVSLFCPREIECVFQVEAKIWLKCNLCVAFTVRADLPGCLVAYDPFSVRGKITRQVLLLHVCCVLTLLGLQINPAFLLLSLNCSYFSDHKRVVFLKMTWGFINLVLTQLCCLYRKMWLEA